MPSSPTILTNYMRLKLIDLLTDYQDNNELNEPTQDHIDHTIYFLCRGECDLNYIGIRQYRHEISLALHRHIHNSGSFTKHTYNKIIKALFATDSL